jgi:hypothetical protein
MSAKSQKTRPDLNLDDNQLKDLHRRLSERQLEAGDYALLLTILDSVVQLRTLLQKRSAGLLKFLRKIFGLKTERTGPRRGQPGKKDSSGNPCPPTKGRNGRHSYPGAQKTCVHHGEYKEGDRCPACATGKLREAEPAAEYAWQGQAPITLTIFLLQRLICDLCKKVFTASLPENACYLLIYSEAQFLDY